jgi:hypothetical protein
LSAAAARTVIEGVGLRLDQLLPTGRWILVTTSADLGARTRRLLWGERPPDARTVTTQTSGWERSLRGLGPQDGVLVRIPREAWATAVRALVAARLHPGPLVLLPSTDDHDDGPGAQEQGALVYLDTMDGPVPALVFRSYRNVLKGDDPGARRAIPTFCLSNRGRMPGEEVNAPVFDITRFNPLGRRPGAREPLAVEPASLSGTLEEIRRDDRLPMYVDLGRPDAGSDRAMTADVIRLLALGVPVRFGSGPPPDLPGAAPRVVAAIRATQDLDLRDPWAQELVSITGRRAAMAEHGWVGDGASSKATRPLASPPYDVPVTVLLVSNRPDRIGDAIDRVAGQDHRPLELVTVAHGFDPDFPTRSDLPMAVLTAPSTATLGDALNMATDAASGAVLVKMDDDDLYAPSHVTDLVLALRYAGATVAGKAPEFVYLGDLDLTVRRGLAFERFGGHIAGGTIAIHRGDLIDLGGWAPVPRAVDSRLLDAVRRGGGSVYRTHGFGFVLNRHGRGHAFEVGLSRYLTRSVGQRAGLDLMFAGVLDPPAR